MKVTLNYHECYGPTINQITDGYIDDSIKIVDSEGIPFWRFSFFSDSGEEIIFRVREDFYTKYRNRKIIFIQLEIFQLKDKKRKNLVKRLKILKYKTFDEISKEENLKFIEVTGIFLAGKETIYNKALKRFEAIYFVPSEPNRFSFKLDYNINLRRYLFAEINATFNDPNFFYTQVFFYLIVTRYDLINWPDPDPSEMSNDYYWKPEFEKSSIILTIDDFINEINTLSANAISNQEMLLKKIELGKRKLEAEVDELKIIKTLAKKRGSRMCKLEYFPKKDEHINNDCTLHFALHEKEISIFLSNLKGKKYDPSSVMLGLNDDEMVTTGDSLNENDFINHYIGNDFYFEIQMLVQV